MNAPPDLGSTTNMTSKGHVLIAKAIRDLVGLIRGEPVRVGINDRGEAVVPPGTIDPRRCGGRVLPACGNTFA